LPDRPLPGWFLIDNHYISGYGDRSRSATIRIIPEKIKEADNFLQRFPETKERFEKVKDLIQGYETPYGLELLATVYWVVKKENITDEIKIVEEIQNWNERKKLLFRKEHIGKALHKLRAVGMI
jgi:hypothetical protein